MYLSLAWRNIWRNKKRSIISISSVSLAVLIALVTRSMQLGFYAHSINNVVSFYTGYMQVHADGYWEKQSLNNSFVDDGSVIKEVEQTRDVTFAAPRLESFALVSAGNRTDGVMVVGIDPNLENRLAKLSGKVVEGSYLKPGDQGIMLGEGLASHLQLGLGDTAVVLGQGFHDVMAAGKYAISGIVNFPVPDLNNSMAYLTMPVAQDLFAAPERITSLAVMIDDHKHLNAVDNRLSDELGKGYEIMTWKDMMPELVEGIETDNASGIIMLCIIYMVIGFGIMGTILMMTMERNREFGMLIAVGMKSYILRIIVAIESVILSLVGVIGGVILGIPIMIYFHYNPIRLTGQLAEATLSYGFEPIFPFSLDPMIFFWQALAVLLIALVVSTYPIYRISKIEPVTALRTG